MLEAYSVMARRLRKRTKVDKPRATTTPASHPVPAHGPWPFLATSSAIVTIAFLLRLYHLGTEELWLDEAVSFRITVLASGLWDVLLNQNTPPLYYLLLRAWAGVAGYSEAALRAPSMVFGTLSVGLAIWLGSMVFSRTVGLWSGMFAAINPLHIYYSQEARAYSLLVFLVVLSYALLWRALEKDNWRPWAGFAAGAALALYTHYMAILSLIPTVFLIFAWQGSEQNVTRWRHYALAVLCAGAVFAPWALVRFSLYSVSGVDWIREAWDHSGPFAILQSLEVLGLGSERGLTIINLKQYADFVFPLGLRLLGLSILIILTASFLVPWGDKMLGVPWIERRKAWLVICLLFPLGVLWAVSFVRPTYVVGRYDMIVFPVYPLVLGLGIAKIGNIRHGGRFLTALLALVFAGVIGAKLFAYFHAGDPSTEARTMAKLLDENIADGDVVVFTGLSAAPIIYYLYRRGYEWEGGTCENRAHGRSFGCRTFPRETERNVGVYTENRVLDSSVEVQRDVRSFIAQLEQTGNKLWLVLDTFESSEEHDYLLSKAEARMVAELQTLGFRPEIAEGRILAFGR